MALRSSESAARCSEEELARLREEFRRKVIAGDWPDDGSGDW